MKDRKMTGTRDQGGASEIDETFIDEHAEGRKEIVDSAARASEQDRADPKSPERRERESGVKDPSHSKGSIRDKS